jgi:hypothetical protein
VPNWAGHSRKRADYRFLAIREPLRQLDLDPGDTALLPFPTQQFGRKGLYKLFGVVTNRKDAGDKVIWWLRERCGKSEEVHAVMKNDLAGGQLPVRQVRHQRRLVGLDDPHPQPQRRDEATGAGQDLDAEPDEGAALPPDRPAGPRGVPCPPADHPPGRCGRDAGDARPRPQDHPRIGMRAGRMTRPAASHPRAVDAIAGASLRCRRGLMPKPANGRLASLVPLTPDSSSVQENHENPVNNPQQLV